jgi:hypothetical protein
MAATTDAIVAQIVRQGTGARSGSVVIAMASLRVGTGIPWPADAPATFLVVMGQIVNVVERQSARPGIVRFETNRALSGTGHDRYVAGDVIDDVRPTDELARRIFARGGINAVHINGSVITVDLEKGYDAAGIADIVRGLYTFYLDGGEELAADDPRALVAARNEELQAQFEASEAAAAAAKAAEEAAAPPAEEAAAPPADEAPAAEAPAADAEAPAEEPATAADEAPPAAEAPTPTDDAPPATEGEAEGHGEVADEPAEVPNEAEGTVTPAEAEAAPAPEAEPAAE